MSTLQVTVTRKIWQEQAQRSEGPGSSSTIQLVLK